MSARELVEQIGQRLHFNELLDDRYADQSVAACASMICLLTSAEGLEVALRMENPPWWRRKAIEIKRQFANDRRAQLAYAVNLLLYEIERIERAEGPREKPLTLQTEGVF